MIEFDDGNKINACARYYQYNFYPVANCLLVDNEQKSSQSGSPQLTSEQSSLASCTNRGQHVIIKNVYFHLVTIIIIIRS